jgi:DNA-binding response OmpR family regulator
MNEQAPTPKNVLEGGLDTASKPEKIADLEAKIEAANRGIKLAEGLKDQTRVDDLLIQRRKLELTLKELGDDLDFTTKPAELVDDDTAMRLEEAGRLGL